MQTIIKTVYCELFLIKHIGTFAYNKRGTVQPSALCGTLAGHGKVFKWPRLPTHHNALVQSLNAV